MRVFMSTDLEGVAGTTTFLAETYPDAKYYEQAKRRLTAEINAACEGLLEAGVEEILALDGHGPGGVDFDTLHPACKLLHGRPLAPRRVYDPIVAQFDACVMIGQHAMAGTATGNLNHTQSSQSITSYTLNGRAIGEIAQCALYRGSFGLPLIFLSGDQDACDEAEALIPGITTAAVKQGLARNCAISLSAQAAHAWIRERIAAAVRKQRTEPVVPLVWEGPYVLEKRFFSSDQADAEEARNLGAERVDSLAVRYRREDIRDIIYL